MQEPVPSAGVITDPRQQIRDIDKGFISGVIVRSKELWVEQGEKPTKYVFNLEKMKQQEKEMTELKSHSDELLSDSKDIRKEMNDFYQDYFLRRRLIWKLKTGLQDLLKTGFQHGQLSVSQHRGLLSLIFKKGKKGTLGIGCQYLCFVLIMKSAPRLSRPDYRKFCLLFCTRIRPVVFQGDLFFRT